MGIPMYLVSPGCKTNFMCIDVGPAICRISRKFKPVLFVHVIGDFEQNRPACSPTCCARNKIQDGCRGIPDFLSTNFHGIQLKIHIKSLKWLTHNRPCFKVTNFHTTGLQRLRDELPAATKTTLKRTDRSTLCIAYLLMRSC